MIKKITWQKTTVPVSELADFLTIHNFQPGKFQLLYHPFKQEVDIVFVKEEK